MSDGKPVAFTWRLRTYCIVAYVDEWRDTGEWWQGESVKDFWRVRTAGGGLFDLYCEPPDQWTLYKESD